jgi:hypothetical protein
MKVEAVAPLNHGAWLPAWRHTPPNCNANIHCCDNLQTEWYYTYFFKIGISSPLHSLLAFVPFIYFPFPPPLLLFFIFFLLPPFSSSSSSSSLSSSHQTSQFFLHHLLVYRNKFFAFRVQGAKVIVNLIKLTLLLKVGEPRFYVSMYTENRMWVLQFIKKNPTRCNNVSTFYYSIFIWSSACFGQQTVHHQESKTALAASGVLYMEGC